MPAGWKKKAKKKKETPTHHGNSVWVFCSCGKTLKSKLCRNYRVADDWLITQHADGTTTCRITTKGTNDKGN